MQKRSILDGSPRFRWMPSGYRRHAFVRKDATDPLCEMEASSKTFPQPNVPCLACLHVIGMGIDWREVIPFWRDARGVVEPRLD